MSQPLDLEGWQCEHGVVYMDYCPLCWSRSVGCGASWLISPRLWIAMGITLVLGVIGARKLVDKFLDKTP